MSSGKPAAQHAIIERIERRSSSPAYSEQPGIEPFDLTTAGVGDLLQNEAPARQMIINGLLPLGVPAILASAGGTGKTMVALQLGVSVTSSQPWLGMPVGVSGSVLMISAEDDRDELHRRLRTVVSYYRRQDPSQADAIEELVVERLFLLDRVGCDNRLTSRGDRDVTFTTMADRIMATAAELPGPVLIILDPLSRFDGGDGNDNSDGTRLIEAAERIRKGTGATVLLPHHVSKAGIRDPDSGQEAVRGASGLVDGARWVGLLATLRRENAASYGIDPDDAGRYVRFTAPKSNYTAPWPGTWLERQPGGVLVPVELQPKARVRGKQAADDRYEETLPKLLDLIRRKQSEGEPLTRRALREYAGSSGIFAMSDRTLRGIVARALDEGKIREHKGESQYSELRTW